MIINVITALCLLGLLVIVGYMIIGYAVRNREGRIAFIRGFKKGKCLVIYLISIPLYIIGRVYQGTDVSVGFENVIIAFLQSITDAITLVIMRFNVTDISKLMADNGFYKAVMYFCFILVIMNTVLFWLSIAGQQFWCFRRDIESKITRKNMLYVFGYNEGSVSIYNSDKNSCKFIVDKISDDDQVVLYGKKISFYSSTLYNDYIDYAFKKISKTNKKFTFVVNTQDDEKNITICRYFVSLLEKYNSTDAKRLFLKIKLYVFGDLKLKAVYEDIVSSAYGTIEYVSVHQKIAMDFVDKYPFTKFMNENHIDPETTLIKKGVNVNVLMVGFGQVNRQIFLTSVANNQFLSKGENGYENKKVNYVIFDKSKSQKNKNLNHDYYRYSDELETINSNDYLPLPDLPASEEYCNFDISDGVFYKKIKSIVSNKNDVNVAIISFGEDLENIDMAQKLIEKRQEWGAQNLIIFVRAKKWRKEQTLLEQEDCYFIGNEEEVVYNIDKIVNDKTFKMSMLRDQIYNLEKLRLENVDGKLNKLDVETAIANSISKWFINKTQLERESGLYCCLSLRSKLNMMGLDYVANDDTTQVGLSEEEYFDIYAKNDPIEFVTSNDGTRVVKYTLNFKDSKRKNLAIQEHLRWNSYMISKGVIPATINDILNETIEVDGKVKHTNGKNYRLRRHGNITTLDGLVDFRKLIANRDNVSEDKTDVFRYDYQLLDEAYTFLTALNYKIVKIK